MENINKNLRKKPSHKYKKVTNTNYAHRKKTLHKKRLRFLLAIILVIFIIIIKVIISDKNHRQ